MGESINFQNGTVLTPGWLNEVNTLKETNLPALQQQFSEHMNDTAPHGAYLPSKTIENRYLVVATDGNDSNSGVATLGTGTITVNGTINVTGSGTLFTTELAVGDYIACSYEVRKVASIISNTSLTLTTAFDQSATVGFRICKNPLRTINAAVAKIPQIVNHVFVIQAAPGDYSSEDIKIEGKLGSGNIYLWGSYDLARASSFIVRTVLMYKTQAYVMVRGFTALGNYSLYQIGFGDCYGSNQHDFLYCSCTNTSSYTGFQSAGGSTTYFVGCKAANRGTGLESTIGATAISSQWDAGSTGNTIGLSSYYGATIAKQYQQPAGATAESTSYGGEIR